MTTNRKVALGAALLSLVVAALPALANLDWQSTAGVLGGLVVILGVVAKWLDGWQQYENHQQIQAEIALSTVADVGLPPQP